MELSLAYSSTEPLPPLEQILNPPEMTCPPYAEEAGRDCSPWVFQKKEKVTPEGGRGVGLWPPAAEGASPLRSVPLRAAAPLLPLETGRPAQEAQAGVTGEAPEGLTECHARS